jgi:hypothetical protein
MKCDCKPALGGLLLILLLPSPASGGISDGNGPWFISPGLKLSYSFGEHKGFCLGFEVSVFTLVKWANGADFGAAGIIFDLDALGPRRRVHIGLEASYMYAGFSLGPTFVSDSTQRSFGFTATVYTWYWVYPYYSFTWLRGGGGIHDIGTYVKLPLPLGRADAFKQ